MFGAGLFLVCSRLPTHSQEDRQMSSNGDTRKFAIPFQLSELSRAKSHASPFLFRRSR